MNKIKTIIVFLFVPFFVLITVVFLQIKKKEEFRQKVVLAQEVRKALYFLMFDLREARESTVLDVPPDGLWHSRIAFDEATQGVLEYFIREGQLVRVNGGKTLLIADHMGGLRIRRQKMTPDIIEVQVTAHKNVSLTSYLKIKILRN